MNMRSSIRYVVVALVVCWAVVGAIGVLIPECQGGSVHRFMPRVKVIGHKLLTGGYAVQPRGILRYEIEHANLRYFRKAELTPHPLLIIGNEVR